MNFITVVLVVLLLSCQPLFAKQQNRQKGTTKTVPTITAKSWLVADSEGNILDSHNKFEVRSIASITKLMTAIVILRNNIPLDEQVGALYGRYVTREKLIDLAMVKSDNQAAKLLCETYPSGYDECIKEMNNTATELGMSNTVFTEPTGLFNSNVSTAIELLKLVQRAIIYPKLVEVSNTRFVELEPLHSKSKKTPKPLLLHNTNRIVHTGVEFLISKTGFIRASGGCIVMTMMTSRGWRTVILLGSTNTRSRITEAQYLAEKY